MIELITRLHQLADRFAAQGETDAPTDIALAVEQLESIPRYSRRITQLECTLYLALDAMDFDAGDWSDESIIRHLRERIELARKHLRNAFDQEALERLVQRFESLSEERRLM
jgi:predicted  nucleic acid-binding Zn-ribbon protein